MRKVHRYYRLFFRMTTSISRTWSRMPASRALACEPRTYETSGSDLEPFRTSRLTGTTPLSGRTLLLASDAYPFQSLTADGLVTRLLVNTKLADAEHDLRKALNTPDRADILRMCAATRINSLD